MPMLICDPDDEPFLTSVHGVMCCFVVLMLLVCLRTGSVWRQDHSGNKVGAHSYWWWTMEVGYVIVVYFIFQDARFTVSPITALSRTVYFSNSDAFRTKHYLYIVTVNTKMLESTAIWTCSSCFLSISSTFKLFTPKECTMRQKCRIIRYTLIIDVLTSYISFRRVPSSEKVTSQR